MAFNFRISATLFLVLCLLRTGKAATPTLPPPALQTLADDFWQWRAQYQPFSKDDIPRLDHPEGPRDWSAASIAKQRSELENFGARWRNLDTRGWSVPQLVDYRLMGSALARVHWELDMNRRWERDPSFYTDQTLTAILEVLLPPPPFDAKRSRLLIARMDDVPQILADSKKNLHPIRPFAEVALADLEQFQPRLQRIASEVGAQLHGESDLSNKLKLSTERAITALAAFKSWLQQNLDKMPGNAAVGRANYEFFLSDVALLPYTPGQLFAISAQEWARSVSFEQYEKQRDADVPPLELAANIDQQVKRSRADELAIRKYLDAKGILSVPENIHHYLIQPMPSYLEGMEYGELDDFTGPSRLHEDSVRWVDSPSPKLGYFALATAKDGRPDMVHEGVPGHYFQMALSWNHEDPIRRHYYDSGANEGIGFYAEEMMLQAGLFDDSPRTREVIYNFMRLRALRVEVDVKLALGSFTLTQAADYLAAHVPMDHKTAEGEAALFATTPGQAISYQIGKNEILRFLADARLAQGDKFNLRAFHDFLWKNGNVPIALQRWEYLGKDDELKQIEQLRQSSSSKH